MNRQHVVSAAKYLNQNGQGVQGVCPAGEVVIVPEGYYGVIFGGEYDPEVLNITAARMAGEEPATDAPRLFREMGFTLCKTPWWKNLIYYPML